MDHIAKILAHYHTGRAESGSSNALYYQQNLLMQQDELHKDKKWIAIWTNFHNNF
jgi:hypothetical protein